MVKYVMCLQYYPLKNWFRYIHTEQGRYDKGVSGDICCTFENYPFHIFVISSSEFFCENLMKSTSWRCGFLESRKGADNFFIFDIAVQNHSISGFVDMGVELVGWCWNWSSWNKAIKWDNNDSFDARKTNKSNNKISF